jgi:hypothetical protein
LPVRVISYQGPLYLTNNAPTIDFVIVEQKSRADFAPDIELPLGMLTATDNIMLGNHDGKSRLEIMLYNA